MQGEGRPHTHTYTRRGVAEMETIIDLVVPGPR